jgi:hypothetical protein
MSYKKAAVLDVAGAFALAVHEPLEKGSTGKGSGELKSA